MKTLTKPVISQSLNQCIRKLMLLTQPMLLAAGLLTLSGLASASSADHESMVIADTSHIATKGYLASGQIELNQMLSNLNRSSAAVQVELPMPDKTYKTVALKLIPELSPALNSVYQIRTFSVNAPGISGQLSATSKGIDAFIYTPKGAVVISSVNPSTSLSYYTKDTTLSELKHQEQIIEPLVKTQLSRGLAARPLNSTDLKTYIIAFSTTSDYALQIGATTVEDVMSELAAMLTVINPIFERELNVRFRLSDQNDKVIFLKSQARVDPFSGNPERDIDINTEVINDNIGLENVDLAHVLGASNGGLAEVNSVCNVPTLNNPSSKARAYSGFRVPSNNYFYVSLVAHEIGHQLGARHSFNATNTPGSTCQENRNGLTAWEPLSGSTIMSYVGLCPGANNLDTSTTLIPGFGTVATIDPFFHIGSINEIRQSERTKECGVNTQTNNTRPSVQSISNLVIPISTPFMLSGSATDPEAAQNTQTLSYRWEQYQTITRGSGLEDNPEDPLDQPLFRSYQPQSQSFRFFPQLSSVLSGNLVKGEQYAQVPRLINLSLSVDDGAGLIGSSATTVQTVGVCPFRVLEPTRQTRWAAGSQQSIYWDTADSNKSPVNCNSVDVLYSPDNFASDNFQVLASAVPNTGSARLTAPQNFSQNSRLAVICHKNSAAGLSPSDSPFANTFYAVSAGTFRVTSAALASAQVTQPAELNNTCGGNPEPPVNPANPNNTNGSGDSGGSGGGSLSPALLLSLALSCLLVACARFGTPSSPSTSASMMKEVDREVAAAIKDQDYRLYALASRFTTLPGIDPAEQAQLIESCGTRFIDASDAIEIGESAQFKAKMERATYYNQLMQSECLKKAELLSSLIDWDSTESQFLFELIPQPLHAFVRDTKQRLHGLSKQRDPKFLYH